MELTDKVVVITGASGGIGLATARACAAAGARVVLAARSAEKLEQLAVELERAGGQALAVPVDMTRQPEVERLVTKTVHKFGRIDVLINNAGQAASGTVAEGNTDDYRRVIELNLFGPLYAIQAAVPAMRRNGGGIIVNISSMTSKMAIPGLGLYASTKAALNVLSATARAELAGDNIRVIAVYPRITATDFGKNSIGDAEMRGRQRAPRPGVPVDSPEHVAGKIVEALRAEPAEQYMDA
jgi:short-subunit dehydrogenase